MRRDVYFFLAEARPPLRPAALCWAVVPPWRLSPPDPDFFPPWLDAFGELAIFAARSFDMPFSFRASYCFLFFTCAVLVGMVAPFRAVGGRVWRSTSASYPVNRRAIRAIVALVEADLHP